MRVCRNYEIGFWGISANTYSWPNATVRLTPSVMRRSLKSHPWTPGSNEEGAFGARAGCRYARCKAQQAVGGVGRWFEACILADALQGGGAWYLVGCSRRPAHRLRGACERSGWSQRHPVSHQHKPPAFAVHLFHHVVCGSPSIRPARAQWPCEPGQSWPRVLRRSGADRLERQRGGLGSSSRDCTSNGGLAHCHNGSSILLEEISRTVTSYTHPEQRSGGTGPPMITIHLQALVHALRDAKVLVNGSLPKAAVVARDDIDR